MSQYQRGDITTIISYNVASASSSAGHRPLPLTLKIRKSEVMKSGNKQITIKGNMCNHNIPLVRVGKPVEGVFKNTYIIVVPKDKDPLEYIKNAKASMRKSLETAKRDLLKRLEFIDKQAAIEDEWLMEKED